MENLIMSTDTLVKTNLDLVKEVHELLFAGKGMEAFEQFYADDVIMVEPLYGTTEGKEANRAREQKFFDSVAEIHGAEVLAYSISEDGNTTMVENWMDVTFKDGNRMKLEQVSVQTWNNGQIVRERFYYNLGQ